MHIVNIQEKIDRLANNGYEFDYEKYFRRGWDLFRAQPLMFILYTVIVFAISTGMGLIPIIGTIASLIIGPALTAGYFVGAQVTAERKQLEIGDFFKSFDFLLQLFLFGLISGLLIVVGIVFLILPGIWFGVAIAFGYPLVALGKMEFWDSIKGSVRVVNKKWFHFFGLFILLIFLNLLGLIALGVGLLITVPVSYLVIFAAYEDIVGTAPAAPMNIADHLVDDQI